MPTITVLLDKRRAARLTRLARRSKISKSAVIQTLIDRAEEIRTGQDLIDWIEQTASKGLGLAQLSGAGLPGHRARRSAGVPGAKA